MRALAAVLSGSTVKAPVLASLKKELLSPFFLDFESYKRRGGPLSMMDCLASPVQVYLREILPTDPWELTEKELRRNLLKKFRVSTLMGGLGRLRLILMENSPSFEETVMARYIHTFNFEVELCQFDFQDKTLRTYFINGVRPTSLGDVLRVQQFSSLEDLVEVTTSLYGEHRDLFERVEAFKPFSRPESHTKEVPTANEKSHKQSSTPSPSPLSPTTSTASKIPSTSTPINCLCYKCNNPGHTPSECTTPLEKYNSREVLNRLRDAASAKIESTAVDPKLQ